MRRAPNVAGLALLAGPLALLGAAPASAATGTTSGSVPTGVVAEAWYRTSPLCALPVGCPPTTTYPADTLHVGVQAGTEESRTYLQLDLSVLPTGAHAIGGTLRLPVAPDSDGSFRPETATLRACLVREAVEPSDGQAATDLPAADCGQAAVEAEYAAAAGADPAAFTLDLAELARTWTSVEPPGALAVLPGEVAATDTWHVALSGRERTGAVVPPPSALVTYVGPAAAGPAAPSVFQPVVPPGSPPGTLPGTGFEAAPPAASLPLAVPQAPAVAPRAQVPVQVTPVALVDGTFQYPAVFLLPLALAGAVGWLGRALTRDLTG